MDTLNLPVIHFDTEFLDGDYQQSSTYSVERLVSVEQFHRVRNAVLHVCRQFGTVGPVGEFQPSSDEDGIHKVAEGPVEDADPDFYVVDDMWNEVDRYVRVEPSSNGTTPHLLRLMAQALSAYPRWAVGFGFADGYLLVFAEKLMVKGQKFRDCHDFASVAAACMSQ